MCYDLLSSCTWWHLAASLRLCMWARRRWSSLVLSFVKRMKMRRIVLLFLVCKSKADSFNYTAYIGNKLFWRPLEAPILHSVVLIDWCLQIQTCMLELVVLIGVVCEFKHTCLNHLGFVGGPMALGTPQCCLRMKLERERERENLSITFLVKKWCMRMCGSGAEEGPVL